LEVILQTTDILERNSSCFQSVVHQIGNNSKEGLVIVGFKEPVCFSC
jgi:hypothetical protein